MTFVLILFVTTYINASVATVPGYASLDQCKAAGQEAKQAQYGTDFVCISGPAKP